MTIIDLVKDQVKEQTTYSNKKKKAILWFVTEIIQFIILVMGTIMMLWLYTPFAMFVKVGITAIITIIMYDILKNFVYVRWILYKESEE